MTSRTWKYLGLTRDGSHELRYRVDGAMPLCVDCEEALASEIAGALIGGLLTGVGEYETKIRYEGNFVTFQYLPRNTFLLDTDTHGDHVVAVSGYAYHPTVM